MFFAPFWSFLGDQGLLGYFFFSGLAPAGYEVKTVINHNKPIYCRTLGYLRELLLFFPLTICGSRFNQGSLSCSVIKWDQLKQVASWCKSMLHLGWFVWVCGGAVAVLQNLMTLPPRTSPFWVHFFWSRDARTPKSGLMLSWIIQLDSPMIFNGRSWFFHIYDGWLHSLVSDITCDITRVQLWFSS